MWSLRRVPNRYWLKSNGEWYSHHLFLFPITPHTSLCFFRHFFFIFLTRLPKLPLNFSLSHSNFSTRPSVRSIKNKSKFQSHLRMFVLCFFNHLRPISMANCPNMRPRFAFLFSINSKSIHLNCFFQTTFSSLFF